MFVQTQKEQGLVFMIIKILFKAMDERTYI